VIDSEFVTRQEAAEILGVNPRTLDRYATNGWLTKYQRLSRILYPRAEVERLNEPKPDAPMTQAGENRRDWL
jgi:predicted site-specific integrase-resolvase